MFSARENFFTSDGEVKNKGESTMEGSVRYLKLWWGRQKILPSGVEISPAKPRLSDKLENSVPMPNCSAIARASFRLDRYWAKGIKPHLCISPASPASSLVGGSTTR